MDEQILELLSQLLISNKNALRIAMRQRAKFEGWLKFELAKQIDLAGFDNVEIETKMERKRSRPDISFSLNYDFYSIELKTCNTSWNIKGIHSKGKPISGNVKGIINDAKKLNSNYGIVVFVMFPLPSGDLRWKPYIERIKEETELEIDYQKNCQILEMEIDDNNKCEILACAFMSRRFNNWL